MPPVTAERSPPLSRMTGADSPVIAASLTEATPSITSPSLGMRSPASTSTISPCLSAVAGTERQVLLRRRRAAWPSCRSWSGAASAACALPRPSATASAKLANSTVNQSQRLIWNEKPRCRAARDEIADEQDRGQRGDDLDHEHHRIARSCGADRASGTRRRSPGSGLPDRSSWRRACACGLFDASGSGRSSMVFDLSRRLPASIAKCSTMGPSASAGK